MEKQLPLSDPKTGQQNKIKRERIGWSVWKGLDTATLPYRGDLHVTPVFILSANLETLISPTQSAQSFAVRHGVLTSFARGQVSLDYTVGPEQCPTLRPWRAAMPVFLAGVATVGFQDAKLQPAHRVPALDEGPVKGPSRKSTTE
jgi:hypothetical protein